MKIYILNKATSQVFVEEMDTKPENTEQFIYTQTPYTIDYLKPDYNEQTDEWFETATQQEVIITQIEKETKLYEKRIEDGKSLVSLMSAKLRIQKSKGIINEQEHLDTEAILLPIRTELLAGQFISAKRLLEPLQAQLTASLYNEAHAILSDYIEENYD